MRGCLFFLFFLVGFGALGQDTLPNVFTIEEMYFHVLHFHPVAKQADLLSERAKQELRIRRGELDPNVMARYYKKTLEGKNYYTLINNTLQIPTWYGPEFRVMYERNSGVNVNGENITPPQGLTNLAVVVPVGQGMIIDERRSAIRQAQIFGSIAEADKIKIINKLLYDASKAYWHWMFNYQRINFTTNAFELAQQRFVAVRERVLQGDLAPIDSIEAYVEVQNREQMLATATIEYRNSAIWLSNYLWQEDVVPVQLSDQAVPSFKGLEITSLTDQELNELINIAQASHPEVMKNKFKMQQLQIERRLAVDKLRPKFTFTYNLLSPGVGIEPNDFTPEHRNNNSKFGVSFYYPLFLRTERGKLQMAKIKIKENDLEARSLQREVENSVRAIYNEYNNLKNQVMIQERMVENYQRLVRGEYERFDAGESSLFLINSREMTLVNSRVKLAELQSKLAQTKAQLYWASGNIYNIDLVK
ncbi:MAG: TolC family protein [Cytophagaceae bacterium]